MSKFMNNAKDPGSAITHFIGMLMAIFAATPIIIKAARTGDSIHVASITIFAVSLILLYAASTCYHYFNLGDKINKRLKKIDHMMIFVLIAGSYTPICLTVIEPPTGHFLLALVWGIAIVGIIIKAFFVFCPKWFSSALYIAMGWVCVIAFTQILNGLPTAGFLLLLIGGIIYTIGGVIYALKLPALCFHKNFGPHEIFHVFVMAGSCCHFIMMFMYVS
ncbi:MAG: hemolysin III family protein [Lachnospiraceae bacterium]|nr:hemolysin III family protein [Lachnospira sp.]MBQ8730283.1 hemolysin III family protein [Lachnospiraceae bacterium]MBR6697053.1 hemolysin III family protein [Lachnospiraceae bacterium]